MYTFLQHLGRSLMLPVAVLPAAAIIVGIGHTLDALNILLSFLQVLGPLY